MTFLGKKNCIVIRNSPKFISKNTIENKSVLVKVMVWRPTDDKSLVQPTLTQIC